MRWAIKHKSGRTLFVTSDEFIASNRREMGWIVEEVKMTSREQFEASWLRRGGEESDLVRYPENHYEAGSGNVGGQYVIDYVQGHWQTWQASRAAIEIELPTTIEVHPFGPRAAKMFCELHKNTVAECAKSILAAGLKVKS